MVLYPAMLSVTKAVRQSSINLSRESIVGKIIQGEILIRTLQTSLLQLFRKIIHDSQVITESVMYQVIDI